MIINIVTVVFIVSNKGYSKILSNLNIHNPTAIAFDMVFSEKDRQNPQDLLLQLQKENDQFENVTVLNTNEIFNESQYIYSHLNKVKMIFKYQG